MATEMTVIPLPEAAREADKWINSRRLLKKSPHNFGVGRLLLRVWQIAAYFPMPSAFEPQSGATALTSFPARGFFSALLDPSPATRPKYCTSFLFCRANEGI